MDPALPAEKLEGIRPVLFSIGSWGVPSYTFFVMAGIVVAALVYHAEARKARQANELTFLVAVGAFVGSAIGAKLLELLIQVDRVRSPNDMYLFLLSGRTLVGGLIGGTIGVWITKRLIGLKEKRGNLFAPAIAIGVAIGRIGCFLNGCCYGQPSHLPWAVDFGDGIPRHPTQLYESAFMLGMFFLIKFGFNKEKIIPGYLFKILMIAYFAFRFLTEYIRVERKAFWGLTYFQVICVFVLIYLAFSDKQLILKQLFQYGKPIRTKPGGTPS